MQILKIEFKNVRFIREVVIPFDRITCFMSNEAGSEKHLLNALGFMSAVALRQEEEWLAREKLQWVDFLNAQDSETNPEFVVEVQLAENRYARWQCTYDLEKHVRITETLVESGNPTFSGAEAMEIEEAKGNEDFRKVQQFLGVFVKPEEHSYDISVDPIKRWPYLSRLTTMVDDMPEEAREKLLEAMQPLFPGIERLGVRYWKDGDKSFYYVLNGIRIGERAMASEDRKVMDIVMGRLSEDNVILLRDVDNCQPEERYSMLAEYLKKAEKSIIVTSQTPAFARHLVGAFVYEIISGVDGAVKVLPLESAKAENQKESNLVPAH